MCKILKDFQDDIQDIVTYSTGGIDVYKHRFDTIRRILVWLFI